MTDATGRSDRGLVGRHEVLAGVRVRVDAVVQSGGGLVLLTGEPGIGKTAAAVAAAAYAGGRGVRVLWASCWQGTGFPGTGRGCGSCAGSPVGAASAPAQLAAEAPALARLLPELPGGGTAPTEPPRAERFQLFDELSTLLLDEARAVPLLVVLDDLHRADPPTLELLAFLARLLPGAPVLVVATCRDTEVDDGDQVGQLLDELAEQATVLPLAPLSEAQVGAIMTEILLRRPVPRRASAIGPDRRRRGIPCQGVERTHGLGIRSMRGWHPRRTRLL
jgi:AAA ATPase-like protein